MNAAAAAMIAIKMQLALIPLDTMIASVNRVSLEAGEIVQVKFYLLHFSDDNQWRPPPPPPPPLLTSFLLSRKLDDKNEGPIFSKWRDSPSDLRWKGQRDIHHRSLFFGKS